MGMEENKSAHCCSKMVTSQDLQRWSVDNKMERKISLNYVLEGERNMVNFVATLSKCEGF